MSTARTDRPLASRSLTRWPPMNPPAPVTRVTSVTEPRLSGLVRKQRRKQLARHDFLHVLRPVRGHELGGALPVGAHALVREVERRPDGGGQRERVDPAG